MPQLRRNNLFRLQRSYFHWDKSFDAPFCKSVYFKLFDYVNNRFPHIYWEKEIKAARKDFAHVDTWGPMELPLEQRRVLLDIEGIKVDITINKIFWCLIFPDHLLITYPLWPCGKQKTMDPMANDFANPKYHYPSRYWYLPDHVYHYFEKIYGERRPESIRPEKQRQYVQTRNQYCEYFATKYKLPRNHFAAVTGTRITERVPTLADILSIN